MNVHVRVIAPPATCEGQVRAGGQLVPLSFRSDGRDQEANVEVPSAWYGQVVVACDGVNGTASGMAWFRDRQDEDLVFHVAADPGGGGRLVLATRGAALEWVWKGLAAAWGVSLLVAAGLLRGRRQDQPPTSEAVGT